jgi:transcriptional regulator with XRE-family HTH domain
MTTAHATSDDGFGAIVGAVIRQARHRAGWTQAHVAELAGLSPNYIARLERGELAPSLYVANRIRLALGISLEELSGRGKAPTTPPAAMTRKTSGLRRRVTASMLPTQGDPTDKK